MAHDESPMDHQYFIDQGYHYENPSVRSNIFSLWLLLTEGDLG